MTTLTFYGGINEIGGNKVLLEDRDVRVFLDFGKNFEKERSFFDEPYLRPREEKHLLSLGILPKIEGLYKKDEKESGIDAILLSHPHTDHMDYIRYIKDDVPIFCGETTKTIITAREFSGRTASKEYAIANLTATKGEEIFKKFITFKTGDTPKEPLKFEPISVDHSVPGAYGLIIHTDDGIIVYTGDFRLHGPRRDLSEKFIERAKKCKPEAMIIEGTNIAEAKIDTEDEVRDKVSQIVSQTSKLVMASFSTVDIDRLMTFYTVAKKKERKLAISMKQAFLIGALQKDEKLPIFDLNDPTILIFMREKKKLSEWEKIIDSKYSNTVESTDLSKDQNKTILVASFYDMNEMAEIQPEPGSVYILSQSEPINEEMEIQYGKLINWLEHYGVPLYSVHASGHATPHQLKHTISEISPKKLFLIHTERPTLYSRFLRDLSIPKVICPEIEKEYAIS